MISKTSARAIPLALVLALGLASCAAEPGESIPGGESGNESSQSGTPAESESAGPLDENGFAIPGEVLNLKLGEPVTYYSYPNLSKDDAQRVTIHSFDYIERADLPSSADMDKMVNGVLVLSLSWESVLGSVQSNQGYVKATLASGEEGRPTAFMDDRLKNGGVDPGETRSGVFTIDIPRGETTLTIVDYQNAPVARIQIDTSK